MAASVLIEDRLERLLAILDEDIRHLGRAMSRLNELRGFVIKRDDIAMRRLLGEIESEAACYASHVPKRQAVRGEIADVLQFGAGEDVTLSRLERVLPEAMAVRVTQRKVKLQSLVKDLRTEYSATVLLLADCARFNRLLLDSIFRWGIYATVAYGSDGTRRRQSGPPVADLLNMKL